jgi:hypothetical protein
LPGNLDRAAIAILSDARFCPQKSAFLHLRTPLLGDSASFSVRTMYWRSKRRTLYYDSGGREMFKQQSSSSESVVTAGFYEPFTAVNAIRALSQVGFNDDDIGMVGIFSGPITNLATFCQAIGVPREHALYYQSSFEEGGVLLIVRAREVVMKQTALAVLNEKGGILPPTIQ